MKRIVQAGIIALLASSGIWVNPPEAEASGWADCLYISDAQVLNLGRLEFQIKIKNGCSSEPSFLSTSIRWRFELSDFRCRPWNTSGTLLRWPSTYLASTVSIDIGTCPPGTYSSTLRLEVPSDFSNQRINLPVFTLLAPQNPAPQSSGGTGTSQTPSTADSSWGEEICVKSSGTGWNCTSGRTWRYESCVDLEGAKTTIKLQRRNSSGTWTTVKTVRAKKDLSSCDDDYPYSLNVSRRESGKPPKYRLLFSDGDWIDLTVRR